METLQETIKNIPDPETRRFFEDAAMYIENQKADKVDPCFAVKPGTPEWRQWEYYLLRRIGRLPWVMREVKAGRGTSATMPARYPRWFDERADQTEHFDRAERLVGPDEKARVSAGLEALGDELTMGKPEAERRRAERKLRGAEVRGKRQPVKVTDEELRARFADLTAADFEPSQELREVLHRRKESAA